MLGFRNKFFKDGIMVGDSPDHNLINIITSSRNKESVFEIILA
jgi:hypothetical protein